MHAVGNNGDQWLATLGAHPISQMPEAEQPLRGSGLPPQFDVCLTINTRATLVGSKGAENDLDGLSLKETNTTKLRTA